MREFLRKIFGRMNGRVHQSGFVSNPSRLLLSQDALLWIPSGSVIAGFEHFACEIIPFCYISILIRLYHLWNTEDRGTYEICAQ